MELELQGASFCDDNNGAGTLVKKMFLINLWLASVSRIT